MSPSPRKIFQSNLGGRAFSNHIHCGEILIMAFPSWESEHLYPLEWYCLSRVWSKKNVECHHSGSIEMEVDMTVHLCRKVQQGMGPQWCFLTFFTSWHLHRMPVTCGMLRLPATTGNPGQHSLESGGLRGKCVKGRLSHLSAHPLEAMLKQNLVTSRYMTTFRKQISQLCPPPPIQELGVCL